MLIHLTNALQRRSGPAGVAFLAAAVLASLPSPLNAQSLFGAAEVDSQRFVLVAAPIGSSTRSQLNIYEQLNNRKPCFAVGQGLPAPVNPLLSTFDFTGICGRYIDANGYSVRIGGTDLATVYRLMVTRGADDLRLLAVPTKAGAGPEMLVARSGGLASGFLKLELEPGWKLMRRRFGARSLGHLYLYRSDWPVAREGVGAALPAGQPAAPPPVR